MVDNSWVEADRKRGGGQSRVMRLKVAITIAIIVVGAIAAVAFNGLGSNATQYKSEGIVVDFGDYNTIWADADLNIINDPVLLLNAVKSQHASEGFDYTLEDGKPVDIQYSEVDYPNDGTHTWGLWCISDGEYDAVKMDDYAIKVSDYSVVIWAYTTAEGKPMPAVDATATSVYGYASPTKIVSLSPVCTETINSVGGVHKIVGTDAYSDYPKIVVERQKEGTISIVGSYTDPSYEAIMSTSPEMVFCDASTYNDIQMAGMLRSSNVNAVVLYNGEDIETIEKNIFITGAALGHNLGSQAYITKIDYSIESIQEVISVQDGLRTMVALSNDPSPWVAGNYTYINDIIEQLNGENVFSDVIGWTNITAESISQKNPECIIIIDSYKYDEDGYDAMMNILSAEWKSTDAYKNGRIYLFAEDLGELGSRAGPRFVQLMELMGMVIDPGAYVDDPLPKSVGNDYRDYLVITGRMAD